MKKNGKSGKDHHCADGAFGGGQFRFDAVSCRNRAPRGDFGTKALGRAFIPKRPKPPLCRLKTKNKGENRNV